MVVLKRNNSFYIYYKNEFFGLEKPKAKEQEDFVEKLFKKDPDLNKYLSVSSPSNKSDNIFHLFLNVKDKENNMYCSDVDDYHQSKPISILKPENIDKDIDKDIDKIAKFIRNQINNALKHYIK